MISFIIINQNRNCNWVGITWISEFHSKADMIKDLKFLSANFLLLSFSMKRCIFKNSKQDIVDVSQWKSTLWLIFDQHQDNFNIIDNNKSNFWILFWHIVLAQIFLNFNKNKCQKGPGLAHFIMFVWKLKVTDVFQSWQLLSSSSFYF